MAFTLLCGEAATGGAGIFLLENVFESKVSVHKVSMLSTASACNKALCIGRGIHLRIGIDSFNGLMKSARPENKHLLPLDTRNLAEIHISRVFPDRARHSKYPTDDYATDLTARPPISVRYSRRCQCSIEVRKLRKLRKLHSINDL